MEFSEYLVNYLEQQNITHVFGFQGGSIIKIVDAIMKNPCMEYIGLRNEQGAAFAAEGYARMCNDVGVALATNGPGATNMITGIANAWDDSIPVLYIVGQASMSDLRPQNSTYRQAAFQEVDIVSIVKPITKFSCTVKNVAQIPEILDKTFYSMLEGRRGPCLLDIPIDIQMSMVNNAPPIQNASHFLPKKPKVNTSTAFDERVITDFLQAKRPLVIAGGGVRLAGAEKKLYRFLEKYRLPLVSSLMGLDLVDKNYPLHLGMLGICGNRSANIAVNNSDFILSVGSRLDKRQTGKQLELFAPHAQLIRIDIDKSEFEHQIKEDEICFHADAGEFLDKLLTFIPECNCNHTKWNQSMMLLRQAYLHEETEPANALIKTLSSQLAEDVTVTLDVGQNLIWASQSLFLREKGRILISGGLGCMGFSLPCIIGAYYAASKSSHVAICGDGGMQMNIQELETIANNKIPVLIIVLNNQCLGMIREQQEDFLDRRYMGTKIQYSAPNFADVAAAYGIQSIRCLEDEFEKIVEQMLPKLTEPILIEVVLNRDTYVYPRQIRGKGLDESLPPVDPYMIKQILESK